MEVTLQDALKAQMQPSSTEKSSRTTLHYVIQNNSARDLVLPPLELEPASSYPSSAE